MIPCIRKVTYCRILFVHTFYHLTIVNYEIKGQKNKPKVKSTLFPQGVEDYAIKMTQVPSSDIQKIALATEDQEMFTPCMVGQLEAQFLKMMAQLASAKRVLDVGTFTGMSAMAFAEGLPADGEVVTIEFDPNIASVADQLFRSSSQSHKLTLKASFVGH